MRPHLHVTQRQVLSRLVRGRRPAEIAKELKIGVSAVSARICSSRRSLGARNNFELVARAIALGLVEAPPAAEGD